MPPKRIGIGSASTPIAVLCITSDIAVSMFDGRTAWVSHLWNLPIVVVDLRNARGSDEYRE